MPRAIEDYICASEDRSHYNNETDYLYGFQYPMRAPHVIVIQDVHKTQIIEREVPDERLNDLIAAHMPEEKETILNELGETIVTQENIDDRIDEIRGGTAADAIKEGDG